MYGKDISSVKQIIVQVEHLNYSNFVLKCSLTEKSAVLWRVSDIPKMSSTTTTIIITFTTTPTTTTTTTIITTTTTLRIDAFDVSLEKYVAKIFK